MALSFADARAALLRELAALRPAGAPEPVELDAAWGRVLAEDARADRDQPPFDRSTRDGYAVRAADVAAASADRPVRLRIAGEAPPGRAFAGKVAPGAAVEILTGAPRPDGADAVVMIEHTARETGPGNGALVVVKRAVAAGENFVPRGSELPAGAVALPAGRRLGPAQLALLASLGVARPRVHPRPRVAILSTGDELVELAATPAPAQIRNSNRHALTAQVAAAGGVPVPLPIAPDRPDALAALCRRAFAEADLVLLSGGVSAGKYDYVEPVLAELGARVVFDGVDLRPGRPVVFGVAPAAGDRGRDPGGAPARPTPFFGLPGNPLSTLVTFALFARPAIDALSGAPPGPLAARAARLAVPFKQQPLALLAFVPARLADDPRDPAYGALCTPITSQGSGDLFAAAAADALMLVPPGTGELPAGAPVQAVTLG